MYIHMLTREQGARIRPGGDDLVGALRPRVVDRHQVRERVPPPVRLGARRKVDLRQFVPPLPLRCRAAAAALPLRRGGRAVSVEPRPRVRRGTAAADSEALTRSSGRSPPCDPNPREYPEHLRRRLRGPKRSDRIRSGAAGGEPHRKQNIGSPTGNKTTLAAELAPEGEDAAVVAAELVGVRIGGRRGRQLRRPPERVARLVHRRRGVRHLRQCVAMVGRGGPRVYNKGMERYMYMCVCVCVYIYRYIYICIVAR